jgi:hypothetical protein
LKNLKKVYLNLSQFGSSANSIQKYLNPLIYESRDGRTGRVPGGRTVEESGDVLYVLGSRRVLVFNLLFCPINRIFE